MADLSLIATRRHPQIAAKLDIWKLIADSYSGGTTYSAGNYLFRHPLEYDEEFEERKKRAVYFNHVQPLADVLAGLLYTTPPERKIEDSLGPMVEKASKKKNIDSFMQSVAINSLLRTCGVLVDSPKFNPDDYPTEASISESGLQPYCTLYLPEQIRDFYCDDDGNLVWILLDNSFRDASDPLAKEYKKKIYRLWTTTEYIDYEIKQERNKVIVTEIDRATHGLGQVPFVFANWRDMDDDYICETPFEDIALLDRSFYSYVSLLDEMINAGTFKLLFMPVEKLSDLPKSLVEGGVSNLGMVNFSPQSSHAPFFAGRGLDDATPFVSCLQLFLKEIFSKIGLDKDQEKNYVQSGTAKSLEFEKCEALLRLGAEQLESVEKRIFELFGLWMGKTNLEVEIIYNRQFQGEDIDSQLSRLYALYMYPVESLKKTTLKRMVDKILPDLSEEEKKEIYSDIDRKKITIENLKQLQTEENTNAKTIQASL